MMSMIHAAASSEGSENIAGAAGVSVGYENAGGWSAVSRHCSLALPKLPASPSFPVEQFPLIGYLPLKSVPLNL